MRLMVIVLALNFGWMSSAAVVSYTEVSLLVEFHSGIIQCADVEGLLVNGVGDYVIEQCSNCSMFTISNSSLVCHLMEYHAVFSFSLCGKHALQASEVLSHLISFNSAGIMIVDDVVIMEGTCSYDICNSVVMAEVNNSASLNKRVFLFLAIACAVLFVVVLCVALITVYRCYNTEAFTRMEPSPVLPMPPRRGDSRQIQLTSNGSSDYIGPEDIASPQNGASQRLLVSNGGQVTASPQPQCVTTTNNNICSDSAQLPTMLPELQNVKCGACNASGGPVASGVMETCQQCTTSVRNLGVVTSPSGLVAVFKIPAKDITTGTDTDNVIPSQSSPGYFEHPINATC